jgi:hypothetical protein
MSMLRPTFSTRKGKGIEFEVPEDELPRLLNSLEQNLKILKRHARGQTKAFRNDLHYCGPRWNIWNVPYAEVPRMIKFVQTLTSVSA